MPDLSADLVGTQVTVEGNVIATNPRGKSLLISHGGKSASVSFPESERSRVAEVELEDCARVRGTVESVEQDRDRLFIVDGTLEESES